MGVNEIDGRWPAGDSCGGCAGCEGEEDAGQVEGLDPSAGGGLAASRREFLRQGALALALLAGTRAALTAQPALRFGRGVRRGDGVVYPVPAADGATIDRGHQVILVRWQGSLYAFALSCPHQHTALRWEEDDGRFQCPKHHSKYQPDGTFISGRATRGMDRYALSVQQGQVTVDMDTLYRQDKDPEGWKTAVVALGAGAPQDAQQPGGKA